MNLDLAGITIDWKAGAGGICTRVITDAEGHEQIQLQVEMGVLQMEAQGRPDGQRFRGHVFACEFIEHELAMENDVTEDDWESLERELQQLNYRRLSYAALVDEAVQADRRERAVELIDRAFDDIDYCLRATELMKSCPDGCDPTFINMRPALVFNRARLRSRRFVLLGEFEEAIDAALGGIPILDEVLSEMGFDDEQRGQDAGIAFLRQNADRLRDKHGIQRTLRERLRDAIDREDFQLASQLHEELARRTKKMQPNAARSSEN